MLFFAPNKTLSEAVCQNLPEKEKKLFFPTETGHTNWSAAKKICKTCPIQEKCLRTALEFEQGMNNENTTGMWGGLTSKERNELRKRMELTAA